MFAAICLSLTATWSSCGQFRRYSKMQAYWANIGVLPVHKFMTHALAVACDTQQHLLHLSCFVSPQTANQTRQLAADTLEELHTQGEKLEKVDRDLNDVRSVSQHSCEASAASQLSHLSTRWSSCDRWHVRLGWQAQHASALTQIDTDVKEAKGILRYMRRCCLCFLCSCCCDCDPDAERDNQRRKRVKACVSLRSGQCSSTYTQATEPSVWGSVFADTGFCGALLLHPMHQRVVLLVGHCLPARDPEVAGVLWHGCRRDQARRSEHEMSQMDRQRRRVQMNGQVSTECLPAAQPNCNGGTCAGWQGHIWSAPLFIVTHHVLKSQL
jgi:hypothetical protein